VKLEFARCFGIMRVHIVTFVYCEFSFGVCYSRASMVEDIGSRRAPI
jgi:hypothetical protein